jgi:hypothetical protein
MTAQTLEDVIANLAAADWSKPDAEQMAVAKLHSFIRPECVDRLVDALIACSREYGRSDADAAEARALLLELANDR